MISLYIKTHKTGLKYLGKTTKDPFKYRGSGKFWLRYIRKYGNDVHTEVIAQFECEQECSEFALELSRTLNVVESPEWANLIEENGRDGAPVGHLGHIFSDEQRAKMSESSTRRWSDPNYRQRMSEIHRVRWESIDRASLNVGWSDDRKESHSRKLKELYKREPERVLTLSVALAGVPKTEEHKDKISKALQGKVKTMEHRLAVSMSRILKYNPDCEFKDYNSLHQRAMELKELGMTTSEIARQLKINWGAAKSLISNAYLLKEE